VLHAPATPNAALVQRADPRPAAVFVKQYATGSAGKTTRDRKPKPHDRTKLRAQPKSHRASSPTATTEAASNDAVVGQQGRPRGDRIRVHRRHRLGRSRVRP
jgi:hypothetical protein